MRDHFSTHAEKTTCSSYDHSNVNVPEEKYCLSIFVMEIDYWINVRDSEIQRPVVSSSVLRCQVIDIIGKGVRTVVR